MEQILQSYSSGKNYQLISIEGNIGSGKTTLLTRLKEEYKNNNKVIFLKEPVDEWESIKDNQGNTMIQKFYNDPARYSFSFQMMAYISRLALLKKTIAQYKDQKDMIFITERNLYTDKYVFAKMLYESGKIEEVDYQIYCKWFEVFAEDEGQVDKIIYVKVDPTICDIRIKGRGRNGESSIPLEYLSSCHEYHENMMKVMVNAEKLVVDGHQKISNWVDNAKTFIEL
jgi:deoxyguanosine kinase